MVRSRPIYKSTRLRVRTCVRKSGPCCYFYTFIPLLAFFLLRFLACFVLPFSLSLSLSLSRLPLSLLLLLFIVLLRLHTSRSSGKSNVRARYLCLYLSFASAATASAACVLASSTGCCCCCWRVSVLFPSWLTTVSYTHLTLPTTPYV